MMFWSSTNDYHQKLAIWVTDDFSPVAVVAAPDGPPLSSIDSASFAFAAFAADFFCLSYLPMPEVRTWC